MERAAAGLMGSGPAGTVPRPRDSAVPAARDVLRGYLGEQSAAFLGQLPRLREARPEALHKIRVACRRARSMLRTFHPLFEPAWADDLAERIAEFTDSVGAERDLEVVRDRLSAALDVLETEMPGTGRARTLLERLMHREHAAAHEATLAALAGPRFHALADLFALAPQAMAFAAGSGAERPATVVLHPLMAESYKAMQRRASRLPDLRKQYAKSPMKAGAPDPAADELWHRMRIAAKRCRYAAEVCATAQVTGEEPAGGRGEADPRPARFAAQMVEVTESLGAQQDAVVASALLLRAARTPRIAAPTGFVLGRLLGDCRAGVLRSRLAFPTLWEQASAPELRQWFE